MDTYPDVDRALASTLEERPDAELLHEVALLTRRSSAEAITVLAARHGVSEKRLREAYESTKRRWREQPPAVQEGAREVLAVVTASGGLNLVSTHRDRDSATALLAALDLEVDDLVCAPDGFPRKPAPAMVRELLRRHGLAPSQCLAVGDRTGDVAAAAAAGVRGALLQTPGIPLDSAGARRIARLTELLPLL